MKKKFKITSKKWKTISINSATHIMGESKEFLDYTLNESDKITNRAFSLILLVSTLLSVIVGYTFDKLINNETSILISLSTGTVIILTILLIFLLLLIFPKQVLVKGQLPRLIATENFLLAPKLTAEENYLMYILNAIEHNQTKIDFNLAKNIKRQLILRIILCAIVAIIPVFLFTALYMVS